MPTDDENRARVAHEREKVHGWTFDAAGYEGGLSSGETWRRWERGGPLTPGVRRAVAVRFSPACWTMARQWPLGSG